MKKEKIEKISSIILYLISLIILITFIVLFITGRFTNYRGETEPLKVMIFGITLCLTTYLGSLLNTKYKKNNKALSNNFIIYLIIYIALFYYFTNIDRGINFGPTKNWSFNLIPFKDIIEIIIYVVKDNTTNGIVQIIGNFLILVPLAYIYPRVFKSTRKLSKFTISIFITTIIIELSQLFFGGGVFDIDDILLNSLGAICFYKLLNNSFLSKTLDRIMLLEDNKLTKKDVIKTIILISIIVLSFASCIYFYWYHDFAISYQIVNKSDVCKEEKILIFEDEYYEYYSCQNIEDIFIEINEKYSFSIKEVLDGKVKSKYVKDFASNARFHFKYEELIDLVPKYPVLEVTYPDSNVSIGPISSPEGIYSYGDMSFSHGEKESSYKALLVPIKEGKITLVFAVYSQPEHEQLDTITYEIIVDDNLNLTYKLLEN